jgi:hypothetical protein
VSYLASFVVASGAILWQAQDVDDINISAEGFANGVVLGGNRLYEIVNRMKDGQDAGGRG